MTARNPEMIASAIDTRFDDAMIAALDGKRSVSVSANPLLKDFRYEGLLLDVPSEHLAIAGNRYALFREALDSPEQTLQIEGSGLGEITMSHFMLRLAKQPGDHRPFEELDLECVGEDAGRFMVDTRSRVFDLTSDGYGEVGRSDVEVMTREIAFGRLILTLPEWFTNI